jgi:glycosyltransferase involved in cell wall biosynthesis
MLCAPAFPAAREARGGVQLALRAQVERLAQRHQVTVVAPLRRYPPLGRYRAKAVEVPWGPADEEEGGPAPIRILRPRHLHLPLLWPLTDPLGVELGLRSALARAGRPDLLHGHWLHPQGLAAARVGHQAGIPVVLTAHGRDVARLAGNRRSDYYRATLRAACARAAAVISVSQAMAARLAEIGCDRERLHVIPNGVDLERFVPRDRAAARVELAGRYPSSPVLAPDRRLLVFAGELEPVKQVDRLLHALALLSASVPEATLAIVGDGPEAAALSELASEHHLGERVLFAGLQPHAAIPIWFQAADLFVLPSATEGLPLVLPEAMACGTPAVASRVGGIPEILRSDETGFLVDPAGVAPLAEALRAALARPWDRAGIRRAAEPYGWDAQVEKIEAIYRAVTAPRARAELRPSPLPVDPRSRR